MFRQRAADRKCCRNPFTLVKIQSPAPHYLLEERKVVNVSSVGVHT